jgi:hypothetical protein
MASPVKPLKADPAKAKKLLDVEAAKDEVPTVPVECAQACNGLCAGLVCCVAPMSQPLQLAIYFHTVNCGLSLITMIWEKSLGVAVWICLVVGCAFTIFLLCLKCVGWVYHRANHHIGVMLLIACMSGQMGGMMLVLFDVGSYWDHTIHFVAYGMNLWIGMVASSYLAWKGIAYSKEACSLYSNFWLAIMWGVTGLAVMFGVGDGFYVGSNILQLTCGLTSMITASML